VPRKTLQGNGYTKNQVVNFKVEVVGKTCGEIFGLVRFHGAGAVCGCGCGSRAGKILPAQLGLTK